MHVGPHANLGCPWVSQDLGSQESPGVTSGAPTVCGTWRAELELERVPLWELADVALRSPR